VWDWAAKAADCEEREPREREAEGKLKSSVSGSVWSRNSRIVRKPLPVGRKNSIAGSVRQMNEVSNSKVMDQDHIPRGVVVFYCSVRAIECFKVEVS
jgi:hypothetical protein